MNLNFNSNKGNINTIEIYAEQLDIEITADDNFFPVFECNTNLEFNCSNNTLIIVKNKKNYTNKCSNINFENPKLNIKLLPNIKYRIITRIKDGNINISNLNIKIIDIETVTGNINLYNTSALDLKLISCHGNVDAELNGSITDYITIPNFWTTSVEYNNGVYNKKEKDGNVGKVLIKGKKQIIRYMR